MQTQNLDNTEHPSLFVIPESARRVLDIQAMMLPDCLADRRQMPNEVVRSALFCAKNRKIARPYYKSEKIAVVGGGEITYTGEELRQDDESVWMHLVHLASKVPLGEPVTFTPYEFLRGLQKTAAKANYEWLLTVLTRMQATAVQFYSDRLGEGVSTSLIYEFKYTKEDTAKYGGKWVVWMGTSLRKLYNEVTYLKWDQRLAVPEGIASKLMGYWASHARPYPVKIDTLRELCRNGMERRDFRKKLVLALKELVAVGFLEEFSFVDDKVCVVRA